MDLQDRINALNISGQQPVAGYKGVLVEMTDENANRQNQMEEPSMGSVSQLSRHAMRNRNNKANIINNRSDCSSTDKF